MSFSSPEPEKIPTSSQALIVGLGNPGIRYEKTRHNIGFEAVKAFASKNGLSFKKESSLNAEIAKGSIAGIPTILLLPLTYMNRSGEAVVKTLRYFKLFEEQLRQASEVQTTGTLASLSKIPEVMLFRMLVIVDDIYTPFGSLKLKERGSSGGHNGLKDIERHIKTQNYPRLKMGVGPLNQDYSQRLELGQPLEDYVLGAFTSMEMPFVNEFVENGAKVVDSWLRGDFRQAAALAGQLRFDSLTE